MESKKYDIVGLGACGIDQITKVKQFSDKDNKVTSNNVTVYEGGVTANNLVQAAKLGLNTLWCGMLGNDNFAEHLIEKFKENNVEFNVKRSGQTQFCWIIVNEDGEKQIYIFPNTTNLLTPATVENNFKDIIEQSKHFHTEIAVIRLNAAIKGAEIARQANSKVFLDIDGDVDYLLNKAKIGTKEELFELIRLSDVIKLSKSAAKQLAGDKEIVEIVKELLQNAELVAITLGEDGCYVANKEEIVKCPAYQVNCVDSTGAGDAFMGGLSYAVLNNYSLKEIGSFANACGAHCSTQMGARSSGSLSDVKGIIENNQKN
jgi:sugar/nucleoside kinase (ribokinase family)